MKSQRNLGFLLSYVSIFISSVIGITFTPYMISSLGKTEYGLYQLLYAAIGYIAMLDFGLGGTLTRYILKYRSYGDEQRVDSVVTMCVKIYSIIALAVFFLTVVVSFNLKSFFKGSINAENAAYARRLFLIMGATTAISLVSHALSGIETAYEKYAVIKCAYLFKQLSRVGIIILLIKFGWGALAVVTADFIITVLIAAFDIYYCTAVLKASLLKGKWESEMFRGLCSFSFFVFLQIVVVQINNGLDRIILGRYSTLEIVALYGVVMQLYALFNSMGGVVSSITLPKISNAVFSNVSVNELTDCCALYSRYQLHITAPLMGGFMLFGKLFASLWSPDYNSTQVLLITVIIVLPQLLESVEGTIFNVMKAKNMQATRSLILIGVALLNVILTVLLLKVMPVYGAAVGTFISFVIGNTILSNIYYHKKVGINIPRYFKRLFKGILPAWIIAFIIGIFISLLPFGGWGGLILKCLAYCIIYAVLIWLLGLDGSEKQVLLRFVKKFKGGHANVE